MSADIKNFPPRPVRTDERVFTCLLMRDDVTLGELMHALRFTGIAVSTHPDSGQVYIHRAPAPNNAA